MVTVPLMSVQQAVTQSIDEVLDPRTRLAVIRTGFFMRAMQKLGPGLNGSFEKAVMEELYKQRERIDRFVECLRELNLT